MTEASQLYLIALGSNRRHVSYGRPSEVVAAAIERLGEVGTVVARSRIIASAPLGPSRRRFANAAVVIETRHEPIALVDRLQAIERDFGRRRARRWGARVIDLDIILWSGGVLATRRLTIPHPGLSERSFVLDPAAEIAADWRDPVGGRSIRQLAKQLSRPKPLDPGPTPF